MSRYAPVELLRPDHAIAAFDCGSEQQTTWLQRHAFSAQNAGTSRVYVVCRMDDGTVAGYYALAGGSIMHADAPARVAAGTGHHPIPVVVLTRLGVDRTEQGRGLGSALVRDAFQKTAVVSQTIGIRGLLIHAQDEGVVAFYRGIDPAFEPSPTDALDLVLLMKDLRAAVVRGGGGPDDRRVSDG